jgi:hypothetical protein
MADRTVNININYKVNTADVLKAQQAATAAQKATDQLRNSTRTYGDTAARASKDASAGLKQVSDSAKGASQQTQSLSSSFGGLFQAARAIVTAGIVREVVDIAINMAKLAGNVEGVERAFKRAFPNSVATMTKLREATKGTITDFELMQRTLQATNLGVAVEQLPQLFEFAAARAQQTGESVDYLVDSIVRGIGRKSPLILDNLGISAIRLKEKFHGAALASQSVADVTKAVAEIAEEELGKMGGFAQTAATKVDQLTVAWENLRIRAAKGSEGLTSGLVSFLTQSVEGWQQLITSNKDLFLEQVRLTASTDALRVVESKAYKEFGDNAQGKFDFLQQEINSRVQLIGRYNDNIAKLKEERQLIDDNNPYDKRIEVLTAQIRAYNDNKVVLASTILALKEYLKAIDLTNKKEEESIISIKTLRDQLTELKKQREEQTFIGNTKELDRLQREIMLLDDRILKIADNIAWQKQWDRSKEESKLAEMQLAEETELLSQIIQGLTDKYVEAAAKAPDFKDSLDEIQEGMTELADTVKLTTGKEFLIRLRLAFQGKGGETSELQAMMNDAMRSLKQGAVDIARDQANSLLDIEVQNLQARLSALHAYYGQQQLLAGDNERAKAQLRLKEERESAVLERKIFEKEKSIRKTQAIIDGAAGIVKAFATYPYPVAIIFSALIAAQTASQLAIINRQQPRFAKGVIGFKGKGTGTSDSNVVRISNNESIIRADRTAASKNLLTAINEGKISDKEINGDVLKKLHVTSEGVKYVGMDDTRIVNELRKQRAPDYMRHANILFEARKSADGLHTRIRRKSMG